MTVLWLIVRFWLACSFAAIEVYGFVLLFSKRNMAQELANDVITGNMWFSVALAPLWIVEALIAGFFYPIVFYFNSGRERKRLSRTLSPAR